jgi:hypothetical protein
MAAETVALNNPKSLLETSAFGFMTIGLGMNLIYTIGYVYISLPSSSGFALSILTGVASTYCAALVMYNLLVLQKKEKPKTPPQLTQEQINTNHCKAGLFLLITVPCALLSIGGGVVTTYQSCTLLGQSLHYSDSVILSFSLFASGVAAISGLLFGYTQTKEVYEAIRGPKSQTAASVV